MGEYQQSARIQATADEVFLYVSSYENLPMFLPTLRSVSPQEGDRVEMRGEVNGHAYEDTGYVRVDCHRRRMDWGSDGDSQYSGWLEIAHGADDSAEVTVHLSFGADSAEGAIQRQTGDREAAINDGIRAALESIRNQVEGRGGKVERSIGSA